MQWFMVNVKEFGCGFLSSTFMSFSIKSCCFAYNKTFCERLKVRVWCVEFEEEDFEQC